MKNQIIQIGYSNKTYIFLSINFHFFIRWDLPLINLQLDDTLPTEDIRKAIFEVDAPVPNQSTINVSELKTFKTYRCNNFEAIYKYFNKIKFFKCLLK